MVVKLSVRARIYEQANIFDRQSKKETERSIKERKLKQLNAKEYVFTPLIASLKCENVLS
jgi:hypothetical protein